MYEYPVFILRIACSTATALGVADVAKKFLRREYYDKYAVFAYTGAVRIQCEYNRTLVSEDWGYMSNEVRLACMQLESPGRV